MFVGKKRPTAGTTKLGEILVEAGVINHEAVNQSKRNLVYEKAGLIVNKPQSLCVLLIRAMSQSTRRSR
jgi:hypothetical protein